MGKHEWIMQAEYDRKFYYLIETDDNPRYIPTKTRAMLLHLAERNPGQYECNICKQLTRFPHVDHVIPVDRGGRCFLRNLQVLCTFCNLSKSNHILDPDSYKKGYVKTIDVDLERKFSKIILERLDDDRY